jgi:hypothetical protein
MRSTISIAVLGTVLISSASGSPIFENSAIYGTGAYRVHQIEAFQASTGSGPESLDHMRQRYHSKLSDPIKGSVTAIPASGRGAYRGADTVFLVPVTINDVTFNMTMDTGSADLWVYSDLLPAEQRGSHPLYKTVPAKKFPGASWQTGYVEGRAAGYVYFDDVAIGPVVAKNQTVQAAALLSRSILSNSNMDGIVGLGFSPTSGIQQNERHIQTWFETVRPTLAEPLFAADLRKGRPGHFDFGVRIMSWQSMRPYKNLN